MFLARCQKSWEEVEFERLTFSIYERVFGKLKNRLGMIPGRDMKHVEKKMRNVRLHARYYHLCYAFGMDAVIIFREIQHNTSSGPPRGISALGDLEERLKKLDKIQKRDCDQRSPMEMKG
ncbi:hypothetical protein E2C01_092980 [Portunus trituberculatus]|uniref:Uncharacterized protein n=1 Tax=Portunus trituberculatus TaxID=210409 RepID=A0A5B7JTP3_PORTR|nr:hypothetical protein [Portunus trituberculatus]